MMTRMKMIGSLCGLAATLGIASRPAQAKTGFPVTHSDADWHTRLSPDQYAVLRDHGTEFAGSSPLDHEMRHGIYHCAGCKLALFDAKTKFDSGTGWPSFYEPLPHAVETSTDRSMMFERTEVHCTRCGSHLGHVFDDGPKPTGLRFCMNGIAMEFAPKG